MKTLVGATSIFALSMCSVSVFADGTQLNAQEIERTLVSETTYSARSSYKWGDDVVQNSTANASQQRSGQHSYANSYKWNGAPVFADMADRDKRLAASGDLRAEQSAYKWGIKSDAEQSAYKWGIKSDAEQSAYKWGIKSDAKQSAYKWGIK